MNQYAMVKSNNEKKYIMKLKNYVLKKKINSK